MEMYNVTFVTIFFRFWFIHPWSEYQNDLFIIFIGLAGGVCFVLSRQVSSVELLLIGRFVVGLAAGLTTTVVPMYLTELAPLRIRGATGVMCQLGSFWCYFDKNPLKRPEIFINYDLIFRYYDWSFTGTNCWIGACPWERFNMALFISVLYVVDTSHCYNIADFTWKSEIFISY